MSIHVKSENELEIMRRAGKALAQVMRALENEVRPGVSTFQIDKLAEDLILEAGGKPAFKGYGEKHNPFPSTVCASLNDEVVHGIPSKEHHLFDGDIVSLDAGVIYKGYQSDAARTHGVGTIDAEAKRLIEVTKESFFRGIAFAKAGNRLYDISTAIQRYVESQGFSVVRDLVGHGIGTEMHEEPEIPNFKPKFGRGIRLKAGMTLAIEPMVNAGSYDVWMLEDDWTIVTQDGSNAAHYENTVLITEDKPIILSQAEGLEL